MQAQNPPSATVAGQGPIRPGLVAQRPQVSIQNSGNQGIRSQSPGINVQIG